MRESTVSADGFGKTGMTEGRSRFPNLMPDFSRYPIDDQKKLAELMGKLGPENFMLQGWINDPELSKFLTVYNSEATVLAERLDMAYATYVRTSELLKLDFEPSERTFLEYLQSTALQHVGRILNVETSDLSKITELMHERSRHRLSDYQYLPGKATDYWQPFKVQVTKHNVDIKKMKTMLGTSRIFGLFQNFQKAKLYVFENKMLFLSKAFNQLNKLIVETEKAILKSSEHDKPHLKNRLMILKLMMENTVDTFSNSCKVKNRNESYYYLSAIEKDKGILKNLQVQRADYWAELPLERINYLFGKSREYDLTPESLRTVNLDSLWKDIQLNATYIHDPRQRDKFRVIVHDKKLIRENKTNDLHNSVFTTNEMTGHKGEGQCAFTLNIRGELFVFNHLSMKPDQNNQVFAHSSMNASDIVVAAGEMTVNKEGQVTSISDYSGHYQPTPYNVYLMIKHLKKQGMDIDNIDVILMTQVDGISGAKEGEAYHYKGIDVFNHFENLEKRFNIGLYRNSQQVQTNATLNDLLEYIKKTDRNTQDPLYKVQYMKDAIFQKITSSHNHVGITQAKNQIAKNVLYNLIEFNKGAMSEDALLKNLNQQKKQLKALGISDRSTLVKKIDSIANKLRALPSKASH